MFVGSTAMGGDDFYTDGHRALQDRFGSRALADRLSQVTVKDAIEPWPRVVIERAPFLWLATADAEGWPDVSYKGGRPGFVRVAEDGRSLAFPSYDGNGMYRSLGNIATGRSPTAPGTSTARARSRPCTHRPTVTCPPSRTGSTARSSSPTCPCAPPAEARPRAVRPPPTRP